MGTLFFLVNIIINMILSMIGIASVTGLNKKLIKTIFNYPALLLLPVFTHIAVGHGDLSTCLRSKDTSERKQLVVSKSMTVLNIGLTVVSYIIVLARWFASPEHGIINLSVLPYSYYV